MNRPALRFFIVVTVADLVAFMATGFARAETSKTIESYRLYMFDLTGDFCTSRSEREFTGRTAGYANQEAQGGTDRNVAAAD